MNLLQPDIDQLWDKWRDRVTPLDRISPWTTGLELAWLAEAADGKRVAEVGSYKGKSALAMAMTARQVVCVDRFQDGTESAFKQNCREGLISGRIQIFAFESGDAAKLFFPESFGMVFIDASHEKADVLRDIELWRPLVRPGGLLCGHDYHPHERDNGVSQAVKATFPAHWNPVDSIWVTIINP